MASHRSDELHIGRKKLVVALDKPTVAEARNLVAQLGSLVDVYKVGLELVMGEDGISFAKELKKSGKQVFLDMKLLDIPNTVEKAVANVARMEFDFLTVHGLDKKTLAAAVKGRDADQRSGKDRLKLLSVTTLTSLVTEDLQQQEIRGLEPAQLALIRARMAHTCGFDGVIASGHEAAAIRSATDAQFIIKVPGIRPANSAVGDQARVMTPGQALRAGATYLVIGRPISAAPNPIEATIDILKEMRTHIAGYELPAGDESENVAAMR